MANLLSLLFLLLLSLFDVSEPAVFSSLDCGATESSVDGNGIPWLSDVGYIQNGEIRVVPNAGSVSLVMSTLRVFSTRKKNCYLFTVDTGDQLLVRASFYYGNYDKKSSPPTFDLQFDANHWATVVTSIDQVVVYEVIYIANGTEISVCVAQTLPNQLPFISAIEVRSLDSSMYNQVDANYALFQRSRVAFGATSIVRFPDDAYDRIWVPAVVSNGLTAIASDTSIMNADVPDKPPIPVLQNAVTPAESSSSIILLTNLPSTPIPIYITMYFAEMSQLDPTANRSFEIYADNQQTSAPIIPQYQVATEFTFTNSTASSNTTIALVATSDSTLPPIISAMEVYVVGPLSNGTDGNDVQALVSLQNAFAMLQEWSGDPCLPATFTWDWVACSSDNSPRITALYLNGLGLVGTLPDFSTLDALQTIDAHNNSLNGSIPDFLGSLPNLKELNLADNDFSGPIPSSISNNNNIKLEISGNPNLCVSGKPCTTSNTGTSPRTSSGTSTGGASTGKKSSNLPVILGSTIPSFLIFWAIVGLLVITHQRRKSAAIAAISTGGLGKPNGPPQPMPTGFAAHMNGHSTNNDIKVEIAEQIGSEFADLMEEQAQAENNNTNA
ncbi:uncharacterized protein At1g24485-like [Tasmannia lanceolata]|uniref:uncharacterized protein At1g24485-like n=1 Tax=Tasmannia lanceolata TaxID=3420 RepID=UPI0040647F59